MPKALRAELHERFADWLDERGGLVELDEVVGHHLEQAALYRLQLGLPSDALAERAGDRLAAAGLRASWRDDTRGAVLLLSRALELLRPLRLDLELELELALNLSMVNLTDASETAIAAATRADELGDSAGAALARASGALHRMLGEGLPVADFDRLCREALPLIEEKGDPALLAHLWFLISMAANFRTQNAEHAEAAERAVEYGRAAGHRRIDLYGLEWALIFGPDPADVALDTLDRVTADLPVGRPALGRAVLLAMHGRATDVWDEAEAVSDQLREVSGGNGCYEYLALIAAADNDYERAVESLLRFYDAAAEGSDVLLSSYRAYHARLLCLLERWDDSESWLGRAEQAGAEVLWAQIFGAQARALLLAERGDLEGAATSAAAAVALADETDSLWLQADAYDDLARVLERAGRTEEAVRAAAEALERYERKRLESGTRRMRERLEVLRRSLPAVD